MSKYLYVYFLVLLLDKKRNTSGLLQISGAAQFNQGSNPLGLSMAPLSKASHSQHSARDAP